MSASYVEDEPQLDVLNKPSESAVALKSLQSLTVLSLVRHMSGKTNQITTKTALTVGSISGFIT